MIGSDLHDLTEVIMRQLNWPKFRAILSKLNTLCLAFASVAFETESSSSNCIARKIAKSVLRDGHFRFYWALGGRALLHQQIFREATLIYLVKFVLSGFIWI